MSDPAPLFDVAFPPLNLPRDCDENPDGSVTVRFDYPREVPMVASAGGGTKTLAEVTLKRIKGDVVLKATQAKSAGAMMVAAAAEMSPAQWHLASAKLDAADGVRVYDAMNELLGGKLDELPDYAIEDGGAVVLPLREIVTDEDGGVHDRLTFRRLTIADLDVIGRAKDTVATGLQRATGLTAKALKEMLPLMDGADIMAAQAVVLFLSGSGRRTGR